MLILPGGGYGRLAAHEGEGFTGWLGSHGIACHVLQYRLGSDGYRHPCMLQDAARGLRMVRAFARDEGLDPNRIGIIGSSAGGHLASTLLTCFDQGQADSSDPIERESSRPDLGILCYPVISGITFPHKGSFTNLLGENPPEERLRLLSNELHVTPQTPPTFIWHTAEDPVVPVENAFLFASALRKAGVPFELHVYEKGRHGLGLPTNDPAAPPWDAACIDWLRRREFLGA
jgi:acetyl esterase/lipase